MSTLQMHHVLHYSLQQKACDVIIETNIVCGLFKMAEFPNGQIIFTELTTSHNSKLILYF